MRFQIGEFWLEKRPNGNYYATWFDTDSRQTGRRSLRTKSLEVAKERLAEHHISSRTLQTESLDSVLFAEILGRYYENHARHIVSEEQARIAIRKLIEFMPGATVAEFNLSAQERFIKSHRAAGLSNGYISRILMVARAALTYGYKHEWLVSAPFVTTAGKGGKRTRVTTPTEMAALIGEIRSRALARWIVLAVSTAARPAAILELKWSEVDLHNGLIHLNPEGREQTNKYRPTVPVCETLRSFLATQNESEFVIGNEIKSVKSQIRLAAKRAGLDKFSAYSIRHHMGMEMRKRNVPAWDVAGMLGHKVAGITEVYAQYNPEYLHVAAKAIDDYWSELLPLVRPDCVLKSEIQPKIAQSACKVRVKPEFSRDAKPLKPLLYMVGHTGFEPVTPTPPAQAKRRKT